MVRHVVSTPIVIVCHAATDLPFQPEQELGQRIADCEVDRRDDEVHLERPDLYQRARARGHDHPYAVRILARAWLHVIWRCWQDNQPYDPTKHTALPRILATAA
jgi:hypothetical protein